MKRLALIWALALLSMAAAGQQTPGTGASKKVQKANYQQAAAFSAKRVRQMVKSTRIRPNWFAGADKFWYEWETTAGKQYYIVDAASGTKTPVFDMDRLARQLTEITRDPYDAQHMPLQLKLKDDKYFQWDLPSKTEKRDSAGNTTGKFVEYRFYYDIAGKKLTWDTDEHPEEYPEWANVSPDGNMGVYVKNHNLYLMDRENLKKAAKDPKDSTLVERALTTDGTATHSYTGDNYTGDTERDSTARNFPYLQWAPDSKHFAFVRWDMAPVKELWVINSLAMPRPELESYHYQLPGEPGPKGQLYVMDPEGTVQIVAWNAFKDQDGEPLHAVRTAKDDQDEFFGMKWLGGNDHFYLVRRSRDLKRHDLCRVDLGADSTRTLVAERMNTYVETRDPRFLPNGDFVWWSERNGWANLYLYGADGTLKKNLTEGSFHIEDILGVAGNYLVVSACGVNPQENPYQMHNYRVPLSGGPMVQLDMDDMDVLATASDNGKYLVANYSRVDYKPAVMLVNTASGKRTPLEEADFSQLFAAGYKFPERFKVKAADGITDLWGEMHKPFDFDSTKVYAIADYVYPGPQVEANEVSWRFNLRTDQLAQLGMIVITVGNRGGHPNRSKWYHNYGYGNLRDYGLEDQKTAVQQLGARHSWIDLDRVGIHGHSGGGFMSTAALLTYPDFFKAAVSCAGNHDNSIYNRWWSEQHHGVQEKVSQGDTSFVYSIHTNQELASRLKGHLLLVHGDQDNNVNPANTIRVVDALIKAHKRFEFVLLPGQRHGFGSMNDWFFWKMADHYSRWLIGDKRERPIDIAPLNND